MTRRSRLRRRPPVENNRPDLILRMYDEVDEVGVNVGAAWQNDNGSIGITLQRGVVLSWEQFGLKKTGFSLSLWPNDAKYEDE